MLYGWAHSRPPTFVCSRGALRKHHVPSRGLYMQTKFSAISLSMLFMLTALTDEANAMSVAPSVVDMTTVGDTRTAQISVINDGSKALPVEIVVSRIELNESGDTASTPAGDEFVIFPPQALIAPGATQNFRLQWVGNPNIEKSQSYNFSVNQVPIKMPEGKSGVQVVFNFVTIVNVSPVQGSAALSILRSGVTKDAQGKLHPEITVSNSGNLHAKLTDATIKLQAGGWSETLKPEQLRVRMGASLIQPGKHGVSNCRLSFPPIPET